MKKNCPGYKALRDKAAQPRAAIGDLSVQAALHEASPQCRGQEARGGCQERGLEIAQSPSWIRS